MQPPIHRNAVKISRAQALTLAASSLALTALPLAAASATDIPVTGAIGELWSRNTHKHGRALEPEKTIIPGQSAYQLFQHGVIIWDKDSGAFFYGANPYSFQLEPRNDYSLLRDTGKFLGAQDALIFGDSQMGEPYHVDHFWVGRGFRDAGYSIHCYGGNSVGALNRTNLHPSYRSSIILGARALPLGNPGIIYLQGSGNDTNRDPHQVAQTMLEIVHRLRDIYPHSRIIVSEVLSKNSPRHAHRHRQSQALREIVRGDGVMVMPNGLWITQKNVEHLMKDDVHLKEANDFEGHRHLAPHFTAWLRYIEKRGFTDVLTNHPTIPQTPFFTEINWMASRGISSGWEDGTFRPAENVSRAAMAAFFYRLAGSPHPAPASPTFRDVPTNHPFFTEISWMAQQNITTGYGDGTFRPAENVSRAAMAAFFYRLAGSPHYSPATQVFRDVPATHPFFTEISWMASQGITTGYGDGTFRPAENVSRAAMAAFFYRYSSRR